ncbi:MAG: DnaJ domain-containing protein [Candidatus Thorarchaeota archaeon]|jgi:DnaJ-class molecular chaperone
MTPYEILGVDKDCSQEDIKRSYRKLSMKFHPDKNPGDQTATAKFQEITQAYSQIENPDKRREYDSTNAGMPPGMNVNMTEADFMQFMQQTMQSMHGQNMFQNFTHQQAQSPLFKALQKPQPIIKRLTITMELAFQGGSIPLTIERWQAMNGEKTHETENIYIDIPCGIDNNEMLIVREKGNVIDNIKGDIKIFVNIENNKQFRRDGLDLIYDKEITLKDALCGFTFDIKYINGKTLKINNKEGSIITPKFKKMVEKLGFKRGQHVGNLIVIFDVKFPSNLSIEQIRSIKEIL